MGANSKLRSTHVYVLLDALSCYISESQLQLAGNRIMCLTKECVFIRQGNGSQGEYFITIISTYMYTGLGKIIRKSILDKIQKINSLLSPI